ncbi:hypothetical protein ABEB36_005219 [Hypothenemus hampei]|uniref:BCAS3 WD40 domain-containing protein n=1 Tax=Hypothenemus hampei TaxID=57062 RepID=A0ABD1EXF0_HYPHA
MSADSPNHARPELSAAIQNIVIPQPVTDPTILDSVAGFINDVVPTTSGDPFDSKDQIQWARFENLDPEDASLNTNNDGGLPCSLILVLGYTTGIQVWAVPANGEAVELFSWRHGSVRVLRILPAPYEAGSSKRDNFQTKRPLMALVDVSTHGSSAGSLNFYSLKSSEQVKQIKFKTQIMDVVANRRCVVITFAEKIAIFDAFTLEDKLTITSCYLSPGLQPNPVALGPRWLAFAEKKLIASRRSSGGNEGEGVQSYTATVLHAAKSLGRGLKELSDAVASSLTGNQVTKLGTSPNSPQAGGSADVPQKGIVTILDVENPSTQNADGSLHPESIVAHFVAHSEAIVWLQFGPCGLLLLTADKRGHDFNLFRINPHPVGSALAAVHHLYTLHRGDTSARVQDMCFSFDSRWVTVSTLRGTTHVFPITPYGGNIGVRTHTTPHLVNKMSRFHRSAGLTSEGRSNSPVSMFDSPVSSNFPYHNPRFTPFPHPTVVNPLVQLRQPVYMQNIGNATPRQGRQRLTSSSEDNIALRVTACFAPARAWIDSTSHGQRETGLHKSAKPVESLFIMNCHGNLVQYDLEPHPASHIPKEKICDDTPIELIVSAKAQWRLQRQPTSIDRPLPLSRQSLIFVSSTIPTVKKKAESGNDEDWLSQVEITTHAGPHRRLWMGPQFTFKTYTTSNGTPMSVADAQPLDLNRSKPVNMPITKANAVLIESSSASSSEQSLLDIYRKNCEELGAAGEHQIKEDLADAMMESPGARNAGGRCVLVSVKSSPTQPRRAAITPSSIAKVVNPLGTVVTVHSDDETETAIAEEIVIYENCDEQLFRPLVTAKNIPYTSSKADGSNIMMQSLRKDTNVTVRVLNKNVETSATNWEDPSRVQDIKTNTKVIVQEAEIKDLLNQKPTMVAKKTKVNNVGKNSPITKIPIKDVGDVKEISESNKKEVYGNQVNKITSINLIAEQIKTNQEMSSSKKASKAKQEKKTIKIDTVNQSELDDSSFGLVNPLYNVLEECDLLKFKKNKTGTLDTNQPTATIVSKKNKSKKPEAESEKLTEVKLDANFSEKTLLAETVVKNKNEDIETEVSFTLQKSKKKLKAEVQIDTVDNVLPSQVHKTSNSRVFNDIGTIKDISFPPLDNNLEDAYFPPLEDNFFSLENLTKTDKYEDAEDCGLPVEQYADQEPPRSPQFVESPSTINDELVYQDEFEKKKSSIKKSRKPKPKLGVKIGTLSKEGSPADKDAILERSSESEVTIPATKKSWSSIAASQPINYSKNDLVEHNSDHSPVESYTMTLSPKRSYSSASSEKLLDIDSPEERNCYSSEAANEYSMEEELSPLEKSTDRSAYSPDLLKLSDKSSDDEKLDSGSSPIEITESSDEGKLMGATEEDYEVRSDRTASSFGKSSGKRKIRKKKK